MIAQACMDVVDASQVGEVRRAAARMAAALKMNETRSGEVAIIATELSTNLVRYGQRGRFLLQPLHTASDVWMELLAIDSGPGMTNLHQCLQDGFSRGGTTGTGLGAVRRLSAEFDAYSIPSKGTVVMSRVRAQGAADAAPPRFTVGAVSVPAPHESVCGDAWRVTERAGEIAVMVADGLGHGPLAAEAAARAGGAFEENPFSEPGPFLERAHRALAGSRGAAVAFAHVSATGSLRYAGIGNIAGTLLGAGGSRGLPTDNGTVGVQIRRTFQPAVYEWPDRGLLVMHSDGVTGRWTLNDYPGLLVRHPALVAGVLFRDFLRGRDDATVVVVGAAARA